MSKNIYFKNCIGQSYFKKNSFLKNKIKLNKIINNILTSIDVKEDIFYLFGKKFGDFIEKKGALWFTITGIFIVVLAGVLYVFFR